MNIKPAKGVVVCRPIKNTTESGLEMVQADDRRRPEIAEVVIAPAKSPYKAGVKLVFRKFMDYKITIGSQTYIFVEEKDILGTYE